MVREIDAEFASSYVFFPGYFLCKMGDLFSSDSELAIDRVNLLNLRPKIFFLA